MIGSKPEVERRGGRLLDTLPEQIKAEGATGRELVAVKTIQLIAVYRRVENQQNAPLPEVPELCQSIFDRP